MVTRDGSERKLDTSNSFVTCLDHYHREREDVGFFAMCPLLVQDFWCGPLRAMTPTVRRIWNGIRVPSYHSNARIRNSCVASSIHKDTWLDICQYAGKAGPNITTYTLEITMDYVAGVEKAKAFSDIT